MTLKEMIGSYDWKEVFKYADKYSCEDVVEIIAYDHGQNEGDDWIGIFKMNDGKFLVINAGCDYTGWGCQEGGASVVYDSLEKAISKFSLGEDWRERLKSELSKYKLDWDSENIQEVKSDGNSYL